MAREVPLMCGIVGGAWTASGAPAWWDLDGGLRALARRGPDDEGTFNDGQAVLGFRRLSIIDPVGGHQPMASEDGTVHGVCNGELYNFKPIRLELQTLGVQFKTDSDSEVLVHGYRTWGLELFRRLDGMFACAIWDSRHQQLILARDPFGEKPLYFAEFAGGVSFASELTALRKAGVPRSKIRPASLHEYLAYGCIAPPNTIFEDIQKLEPGHYRVWARGEFVEDSAYGVPLESLRADRRPSRDEAARRVRELLWATVESRLVADVPVGLLLSGGMDSGTVAAAMSGFAGPNVRSFTVTYDDPDYSEESLAELSARHFRTQHLSMRLGPGVWDEIPEIAGLYDEPLGDSSVVPTYFVTRLASESVKVVLTGDGGDEIFAGYHSYGRATLRRRLAADSGSVRAVAGFLGRASAGRLSGFSSRAIEALGQHPEAHHVRGRIFGPADRSRLLSGTPFERGLTHCPESDKQRMVPLGVRVPTRYQLADLKNYLEPDLLVKIDRASMYWGLEARAPLLNLELARYVLSLPPEYLNDGRRGKLLLRRAVRDDLPPEILHGRKRGFSAPVGRWIRTQWARDVAAMFKSETALETVLSPAWTARIVDEHLSGQHPNDEGVWSLISLELWLRKHWAQ